MALVIRPRSRTICESSSSYLCRIDLSSGYRYCLVAIAVMCFSVIYWAGWWIVLPRIFRYRLVPTKDTLRDGTVITVVSAPVTPLISAKPVAHFFFVRLLFLVQT